MNLTRNEFWNGVKILFENQHVLQSRLCGIKILYEKELPIEEIQKFAEMTKTDFDNWTSTLRFNEISCKTIDLETFISEGDKNYVLVTKMILKNSTSIGCQLINIKENSFYFKSFSYDLYDYCLKLENGNLILQTTNDSEQEFDFKKANWLNYYFKPKFLKWAKTQKLTKKAISSLELIDLEDYVTVHQNLKDKYANDIIKIWPEATDPLKFVHEDLLIAAYLICLWKKLNEKPKFVDLGCGNGLLVYILVSSGFDGYGIDVRKRKIWNYYPENVRLIETVINPADELPNLNANWLIGNHSDELSPWLPVLAIRNSYDTKFFLLPCCAYEFSGEKYQRRTTHNSTYTDFLDYAKKISKQCDFEVKMDRLKIPSTKRIAIIGSRRNYTQSEYENKLKELRNFIAEEMKINSLVKLRNKVEDVKNCTQIQEKIRDALILKMFNFILGLNVDIVLKNSVSVSKSNVENYLKESEWQMGKSVNFTEIGYIFDANDFRKIKSQSGGLKTLLKNYSEIFIIKGNLISLKKPNADKINTLKKIENLRKRKCFFFINHPNGCPLKADECCFIHSK